MFLSCVDHVDRSGRAGHAAGVDAHLWRGCRRRPPPPARVSGVCSVRLDDYRMECTPVYGEPHNFAAGSARHRSHASLSLSSRRDRRVYSRSAVPLCHRSPYTLSSLAGASQVVSCAGLHRSTDSELDLVGSTLSPPAHKGFGQVHRDDAPRILEHELVGLLTGLDNVAHVRGELVHRPHLLDAVQRDEALLGRHRQ